MIFILWNITKKQHHSVLLSFYMTQNKKRENPHICRFSRLVDPRGIEPLTSRLRTWRSPMRYRYMPLKTNTITFFTDHCSNSQHNAAYWNAHTFSQSYESFTFVDNLSKGIQYNKNDVQIEFFKDAACTDRVAVWNEQDGKFTASYTDYSSESGSSMTIAMTADGLAEINAAATVYDPATSLLRGYSNLTMRITYACTVNSDAAVVYGDSGNPNDVTLTWKRTNTDYYDPLTDDCHVYTYGIDLTKEFSDNNGSFDNVKFLLKNATDN